MTTHLRTRAIQVGALLALAGGMIAVASTPALANQPIVQITTVSSVDLPSSGKATLRYSVQNKNPVTSSFKVQINGGGMSCTDGDCGPEGSLDPNETQSFQVQLTAPAVNDGQTRNITVQITATVNNIESGQATKSFTVRGADKPKTVRQVTGRVKDQDGKAVSGANVGVQDSAGHVARAVTSNDGRFAINSTDATPILAGRLTVGAVKTGFSQVTVTVTGTADKTLNVPLTMQGAAATPSATPSATVTVSPPPTDDATDPATDAVTDGATGAATDAASKKDSGSSSTLFIILGGLLVAAGIGAIVLVLMRRKNGGDDGDDPDDDNAPSGGPVPPSRGTFHDATRVGAPAGGGGRNDATMIAQGGPSIGDAPTMMQQAVPLDDEFPDPYGVPVPQGGGYAGNAGAYGAADQYGNGTYGGAVAPAQSGGYEPGPATQFGQPPVAGDDPYAAFGAGNGYPAGGAAQQRFDEPTGMYRPEPGGYGADGYGQDPEPAYPAPRRGDQTGGYQGGTYGGAGSSYGGGQDEAPAEQGGYGTWGAPAGGIDNNDGYGPPAGGGTYGGGGAAGGGAAGGGQGAAYGAPAGGGNGGYGADQGGFDERGGYGAEPYDRGAPAGGNGYGGAPAGGNGYGGAPAGGNGYGGAPAGGNGYGGAPAGGNGYGGAPAGGNGYGGASAGNDYDGGPAGGGAGAAGGGYGGGPAGGAGYGGADQGGYPDQGGYGGGQGRGYGADQDAGYDAGAAGGYYGADDQRGGGRHGGQSRPPQPESTRPGQRRPLDWLDD